MHSTRMHLIRLAAPATLVALTLIVARARASTPTLDEIRAAHIAAVQSIHSVCCQVIVERTPAHGLPPSKGSFWRSGEAARASYGPDHNGQMVTTVYKDGTVRLLQRPSQPTSDSRVSASIVVDDGSKRSPIDAWTGGLLAFSHPHQMRYVSFEEILQHPGVKVGAIVRRTESSGEWIVVELHHDNVVRQFWFDPRRNWLVRKLTVRYTSGPAGMSNQHSVSEVLQFREASPGIYFPEQTRSIRYEGDKEVSASVMTCTQIRINQDPAPDLFRLDFPPGTHVHDLIARKKYVIGDRGEESSVQDLDSAMTGNNPVTSLTETKSEPRGFPWWLLRISAAAFVVLGVVWIIRKRYSEI